MLDRVDLQAIAARMWATQREALMRRTSAGADAYCFDAKSSLVCVRRGLKGKHSDKQRAVTFRSEFQARDFARDVEVHPGPGLVPNARKPRPSPRRRRVSA